MRGARILAAHPTGSPAKTNLSVHATAAGTTARESISRGRHRDQWIVRMSRSRRMGRFWWMFPSSISGRKDSRVNLTMTARFCRCSPLLRRGLRPALARAGRLRDSRQDAGATKKRMAMAEENGNGKNGNRVGLLERVKAGVKQDVQSLKTDMPAKAKEQIDLLKD